MNASEEDSTTTQNVYTVCGVTAEESALDGNVARVHVKRENLEQRTASTKMEEEPEAEVEEKPVRTPGRPGRKRKVKEEPVEVKPKRPRGRPRLSDRPPKPEPEKPPREPSPPIVNGAKRRRKPNRLLVDYVDPETKKDEDEEYVSDSSDETDERKTDDQEWTPLKRRYIKKSTQSDDDQFIPLDPQSLRKYYGNKHKIFGASSSEENDDDFDHSIFGSGLEDDDDKCSYVLVYDDRKSFAQLLNEKNSKKHDYDFNKLVRYLKMVKLPAPMWKIRIVVSREQSISEVTFTNKEEREKERCVKFSRASVGHVITFGRKVATLIGAPSKINCANDITILLDIVHGLKDIDPVLNYN